MSLLLIFSFFANLCRARRVRGVELCLTVFLQCSADVQTQRIRSTCDRSSTSPFRVIARNVHSFDDISHPAQHTLLDHHHRSPPSILTPRSPKDQRDSEVDLLPFLLFSSVLSLSDIVSRPVDVHSHVILTIPRQGYPSSRLLLVQHSKQRNIVSPQSKWRFLYLVPVEAPLPNNTLCCPKNGKHPVASGGNAQIKQLN